MDEVFFFLYCLSVNPFQEKLGPLILGLIHCVCRVMALKIECASELLKQLIEIHVIALLWASDSRSLEWGGLRMCTYNNFPGHLDALIGGSFFKNHGMEPIPPSVRRTYCITLYFKQREDVSKSSLRFSLKLSRKRIKRKAEEFLLWRNGISGISGALGCRFDPWPGTVG